MHSNAMAEGPVEPLLTGLFEDLGLEIHCWRVVVMNSRAELALRPNLLDRKRSGQSG